MASRACATIVVRMGDKREHSRLITMPNYGILPVYVRDAHVRTEVSLALLTAMSDYPDYVSIDVQIRRSG